MNNELIDIVEIRTREDLRRFVDFPFTLYSQYPQWTPPMIAPGIDENPPIIRSGSALSARSTSAN